MASASLAPALGRSDGLHCPENDFETIVIIPAPSPVGTHWDEFISADVLPYKGEIEANPKNIAAMTEAAKRYGVYA